MNKSLYLRAELNPNEFRTPLIPSDMEKLIENGWIIWIQSSNSRIYSDESYEKVNCKITKLPWYNIEFSNCLILGLKQFEDIEKLNSHKHIYFSHSYQNQSGSKEILTYFKNSSSILYDLEYFIDNNNRLTSFGFWAGIIGCGLALLEYSKPINNLNPWKNFDIFLQKIKVNLNNISNLSIGIIGSEGNCGKGSKFLLTLLDLKYDNILKNDDKSKLFNYDILINCIKLDINQNEIWLDLNTNFIKPMIISDISCDVTKSNNPIKLNYNNTTWVNPVHILNLSHEIKIISIDNLPSLLPKDSSDYFSNCLVNILLNFPEDKKNFFKKNYNTFLDIIQNL